MAAYPESDARVQQLAGLGFPVADCQAALEACGGSLEAATERLLKDARGANTELARRVNTALRKIRPWSEFFDRFLWPEHWGDRVSTNLVHYEANYMAICLVLFVLWGAAQPGLLLSFNLFAVLGMLALYWSSFDSSMPELPIQAIYGFAVLGILLLVPFLFSLIRLAVICATLVLTHASFRARTVSSRFSRLSRDVMGRIQGVQRGIASQMGQLTGQGPQPSSAPKED